MPDCMRILGVCTAPRLSTTSRAARKRTRRPSDKASTPTARLRSNKTRVTSVRVSAVRLRCRWSRVSPGVQWRPRSAACPGPVRGRTPDARAFGARHREHRSDPVGDLATGIDQHERRDHQLDLFRNDRVDELGDVIGKEKPVDLAEESVRETPARVAFRVRQRPDWRGLSLRTRWQSDARRRRRLSCLRRPPWKRTGKRSIPRGGRTSRNRGSRSPAHGAGRSFRRIRTATCPRLPSSPAGYRHPGRRAPSRPALPGSDVFALPPTRQRSGDRPAAAVRGCPGQRDDHPAGRKCATLRDTAVLTAVRGLAHLLEDPRQLSPCRRHPPRYAQTATAV
jgi:hypothetical protein